MISPHLCRSRHALRGVARWVVAALAGLVVAHAGGASRHAQAATCTWIAASASGWTNPGSWSNCGGTIPGSADTAVFNSSNNGECNIYENTTVTTLNISGFTGGLVSNGLSSARRTLTVTGNYSQSSGTFNSNISTYPVAGLIVNGNVTLSGGTLVAPTAMVVHGTFTQSGGTFTGSSSPIILGAFTQSDGVFTASDNLVIRGAVSRTGGTFTAGSGTVLLAPKASVSADFGGATLSNLRFESTSETNLVAYWKFDERVGLSIRDLSSNSRHVTLASTNTWNSSGAALNFYNAGSTTFSLTDTDGSFTTDFYNPVTVSAWVYLTANGEGDNPRIISTPYFQLLVRTIDDKVRFEVPWSTSTPSWEGSLAISRNTWQHIAVTYDGSSYANTPTFWIHGTQATTSIGSGAQPGSGETRSNASGTGSGTIGARHTDGARDFVGSIDEVRIYNAVLSSDEIALLKAGKYVGRGGGATVTTSTATTVGGNVTLDSGALATGSTAVTVGGSWTNHGALYTGTGTVTFNATSGSKTIASKGQPFGALTFNGAGGGWTLSDRLWVDGVLTIAAGTLATGNYVVHAATLSKTDGVGAVFTPGTGTLVLDSTTSRVVTVDSALNNLRVEDPSETGLLSYFKFDEPFGTTARDRSGNANHGTLTNGVTRITSNLVSSAAGTPSIRFDNPGAVSFDGDDDVVSFPVSDPSAITVSAFIKMPTSGNGDSNFPRIVELGTAGSSFLTFQVRANGSDVTAACAFGMTTTWNTQTGNWRTSASGITRNTWHHVAVTYDGSSASNIPIFYLNGVVQTHGTATAAMGTRGAGSGTGYIGNTSTGSASFPGSIDDVRIYNTVLTETEIQALAAGGYAARGGTSIFTMQENTTVSGTTTEDSGTIQWVYRAHEDPVGSIEGFPITAFSWSTFEYHATYATYNNASNSNTGKLFKRNTSGGATASWTLPSGVNFVGAPKYTESGGTYTVYVLATNGTAYKLRDDGASFTELASFRDTCTGGGCTNQATATSPLAVDGTNVYWSGKNGDGTAMLFSLQQSDFTTVASTAIAQVDAVGSVATVGATNYFFFANSTAFYRAAVSPLGSPTSPSPAWSPSNGAVYGRVTVLAGTAYFVDYAGTAWAANPSTLAKVWSYKDTTNHAGCVAGGSCAAKNVFFNFGQGRLYFGDKDGHVYALNTSDGSIRTGYPYATPGGETIETAPLYRSGILGVGTTSGKVFFIDQDTGSGSPGLLESYDFCQTTPCTDSAIGTIAYDSDGGQYMIGTKNGKLYYVGAITDSTSPN